MISNLRRLAANRFALMTCALGLLVSMATAAQAPEAQRHYYNSQRIQKLHPWEQPKAGAVLADLESHGDKPLIQVQVWRTPAEQAALKKAGKSQLSYSFHNVTAPDGTPQSLAFDIADYYMGYKVPNGYWLRLGSASESHQLTTGVYWGLSTANRNKIHAAIAKKNWTAPVSIGWDAGHSEPQASIITVAEAKRGLRPPVKRTK